MKDAIQAPLKFRSDARSATPSGAEFEDMGHRTARRSGERYRELGNWPMGPRYGHIPRRGGRHGAARRFPEAAAVATSPWRDPRQRGVGGCAVPGFHKIPPKSRRHAREIVRRRIWRRCASATGRNVILYYSGWLQGPGAGGMAGHDNSDKNGFMSAARRLGREAAPRGWISSSTRRAGRLPPPNRWETTCGRCLAPTFARVVPQLALSGRHHDGMRGKTIVMGKHSSLGPIDPQIPGGMSAHGVVEEFKRAAQRD